MILTIATDEINLLLQSSGRRKVDLELVELDEDKAVLIVRKGLRQRLTLTNFQLKDGEWIYTKVKPALLIRIISLLPFFQGHEDLILKDDTIGFKPPRRVSQEVEFEIRSIRVRPGAVVIEGQLTAPPV